MAKGTVSPVFAGREDELAVLADAFSAAVGRTPGIVLVGAEAGGGKSRLAAEFTARVAGRSLVISGGCVELSSVGLPYAPFTAALRELVRERGTAQVAGLLPGSARRRVVRAAAGVRRPAIGRRPGDGPGPAVRTAAVPAGSTG